MSASQIPNDAESHWLIIVPMIQLRISDAPPINGKWKVGDISFFSETALRSHLEPPTINQPLGAEAHQRIFNGSDSYAVFKRQGTPKDLRHVAFRELRNAAELLASTAAFYSQRHHSCGFTVGGYPMSTAKYDTFLDLDGTDFTGNWNQRGMLTPFDLDATWYDFITETGAIDLFARLVDPHLDADWRRQIGNAAAMLGRSLMSLDLADAFMLNVIGLETLLTQKNERNSGKLTQRIKGMTGWHLRNHRPNYETEIKSIHSIRCDIVHDSDYRHLTIESLLLADMYLANILLNVVRLPLVFPNKAALVTVTDGFALDQNWSIDGSNPFRWVGGSTFDANDLSLHLW